MNSFRHDDLDLAFLDKSPEPDAQPILLIHGFASNHLVNWVSTGWIKTLNDAGYRTIAFDNRGHGSSSVSYDPADYTPRKMAGDAAALLDHLNVGRAHVMGYSMGARIAAFLALEQPETVASLIFGGLGSAMVDGVGEWGPISDALLAEDATTINDPGGKAFRAFADQTRSDRKALAACIATSRQLPTRDEIARIAQPTLVAVGTKDDIGGTPQGLADLMPNGQSFAIEGRDHMLAVGDRAFKERVIGFLADHPIAGG